MTPAKRSSCFLGLIAPAVLAALEPVTAQAQCLTWSNKTQAVAPGRRAYDTVVYDSNRALTLMFGGNSPDYSTYNRELWEGDQGAWVLRANSGPAGRYGQSMSFDSNRGVAVVFGGYDGSSLLGDTWEWNGSTGTWALRTSSGPAPRLHSMMAYDSDRKVSVLIHGWTGNVVHFTETWEWNGATGVWTLRSMSGPSGRSQGGFVYDSDRKVCVLYGGYNQTLGFTNELWEWDGAAGTWTQRTPAGSVPAGRYGLGLAYDSTRKVSVLFGGYTDTTFFNNETWEWNGAANAWTQRVIAAPVARREFSMAYDSARGACVLFGGQTNGSNATLSTETWELRSAAPWFTPQPRSQLVPNGADAAFTSLASSTTAVTYQWSKNGAPLSDTGNISGSSTATLVISPSGAADVGSYHVVATNACGSTPSRPALLAVSGLIVPTSCPGDANADRMVTFADITAVFTNWGFVCPP